VRLELLFLSFSLQSLLSSAVLGAQCWLSAVIYPYTPRLPRRSSARADASSARNARRCGSHGPTRPRRKRLLRLIVAHAVNACTQLSTDVEANARRKPETLATRIRPRGSLHCYTIIARGPIRLCRTLLRLGPLREVHTRSRGRRRHRDERTNSAQRAESFKLYRCSQPSVSQLTRASRWTAVDRLSPLPPLNNAKSAMRHAVNRASLAP
jgi:hypothetical protein